MTKLKLFKSQVSVCYLQDSPEVKGAKGAKAVVCPQLMLIPEDIQEPSERVAQRKEIDVVPVILVEIITNKFYV